MMIRMPVTANSDPQTRSAITLSLPHLALMGVFGNMEMQRGGAGLARSMSKNGCSPDNSACEGFFGGIKNEMFYNCSWEGVSIAQFVDELDGYLRWYCESPRLCEVGAI